MGKEEWRNNKRQSDGDQREYSQTHITGAGGQVQPGEDDQVYPDGGRQDQDRIGSVLFEFFQVERQQGLHGPTYPPQSPLPEGKGEGAYVSDLWTT